MGLLGPVAEYPSHAELVSRRYVRTLARYVPQVKDDSGELHLGKPVRLDPGWNLVRWDARAPAQLVYGDVVPPVFQIDTGLKNEIHPADLPFGVTIRGDVVDQVGAFKARHLFVQEFRPLAVGQDGKVHLEIRIDDAAGNERTVPIVLVVTDNAVRRGMNSQYYRQGASTDTSTNPASGTAARQ